MNNEQFNKLDSDALVQPNYPEYSNEGFRILTINWREGLVEVDEVRAFNQTTWYRYENLSVVVYSKVFDNETFEEAEKYTKK
jgi:hypothetical protein